MNQKTISAGVLLLAVLIVWMTIPPPQPASASKKKADEALKIMSKQKAAADIKLIAAKAAMGLPTPDTCNVAATRSAYFDDESLGHADYTTAEGHEGTGDQHYQEFNYTLAEVYWLLAATYYGLSVGHYGDAKAHADACPSSCAYH